MMMFLWACERFKLDLVSYRCRADGTKRVEIDRTEIFTHLRFWPEIIVRSAPGEDPARTEARFRKALASAQKYSLVSEFREKRDHCGTRDLWSWDTETRGRAGRSEDERRMTQYAIRNTQHATPSQPKEPTLMTLPIKVLGGGCANCANLEKNATAAVAGLGVEARIEHVSDPAEYARYGVLYTPGLVINDKLASAGRVPSVAEVTTLLTNVLAAA